MNEPKKRGRPRTRPLPPPSQRVTVSYNGRVVIVHRNVPGALTIAQIAERYGIGPSYAIDTEDEPQ